MSRADHINGDAADWVERLNSPTVDAGVWEAFDAWLAQSPEHELSYDQALAASLAIQVRAARLLDELDAPSPSPSRNLRLAWPWRPGATSFAPWALGLSAVAATVLVVIPVWREQAYTSYSTGRGEHRTLTLADGSRVYLNAGSRIRVRQDGQARRVIVDDAQAIFDVTRDPARPFLIEAGDETIKVVGTQFDVRRRDGQIAVTVARGVVEVSSRSGSPVRLRPGQQLDHHEGDLQSTVLPVAPAEVFGWREGRLIYRDASLREVVSDISRYTDRPVQVNGAAAGLRFSGVIIVGNSDEMLQRLTQLVPVTATTTQEAIVLNSR